MKTTYLIATLLTTVLTLAAYAGTQNKKAHVHGSMQLTVTLDTASSGQILLDGPGDSIIGFEHEAKSKKDKAQQNLAFSTLKTSADRVVLFDSTKGCQVTAKEIGIEKEEGEPHEDKQTHSNKKEAQHSDLNATYEFHCDKVLKGSIVKVGLFEVFPKIKAISLKILSEAGQTEKVVKTSADSASIE